ncbi:antitoxin [Streptococcus sp. NLN76]|uniref:antitoxin n=1 Tax=Streptococcus sp. NLN76 TaxID=2822800 RepID=UPI0018A9D938|nr:antitoxin [Streptococcus sp. NLN76]MBF8969516.1 antitoxin [Streptococcus sp. NLN76]
MANTQPVNFRADTAYYQQTKDTLKKEGLTVSDILNATLRKVATGAVDPKVFVTSDLEDSSYDVAFQDLKREVLRGHREIMDGKVTPLTEVRKEFGLE